MHGPVERAPAAAPSCCPLFWMHTISPLLLARQTIFRLPIVCTSRTFSAMPPNKLPESSPNFASEDGRYHRQTSDFLHHVAKGTKFEPEVGRYKLIVSLACPWAHRALIVRHLKRMHEVENLLPLTIVDTFLGREGWSCLLYTSPSPRD